MLPPTIIPLCAQLAAHALSDTSIQDQLAAQGVDVMQLQQALMAEVRLDDTDTYDLTAGVVQATTKPGTANVQRNVGTLLVLYGKRSLSGSQVAEALSSCTPQQLVQFIMTDVAGWKPPQKRAKVPA